VQRNSIERYGSVLKALWLRPLPPKQSGFIEQIELLLSTQKRE